MKTEDQHNSHKKFSALHIQKDTFYDKRIQKASFTTSYRCYNSRERTHAGVIVEKKLFSAPPFIQLIKIRQKTNTNVQCNSGTTDVKFFCSPKRYFVPESVPGKAPIRDVNCPRGYNARI